MENTDVLIIFYPMRNRIFAVDFDYTITFNPVNAIVNTENSISLMGGIDRIHLIRNLFDDIKNKNILIYIVSYNKKEIITSFLKQIGIFKHVLDIYDITCIQKFGSKKKLIDNIMVLNAVIPEDCILVDDEEKNIRNAKFKTFLVAKNCGINIASSKQIRKFFDIN